MLASGGKFAPMSDAPAPSVIQHTDDLRTKDMATKLKVAPLIVSKSSIVGMQYQGHLSVVFVMISFLLQAMLFSFCNIQICKIN